MSNECCCESSCECCCRGRREDSPVLQPKRVLIEYLYLDLTVCDRCIGTDQVLDRAVAAVTPALELAGFQVCYEKKVMDCRKTAEQHRFLSSPTILVNGRDICDTVLESDCGCCASISGTQVDCRVFEYEGRRYEVPPIAMLTEAILKGAFRPMEKQDAPFELPENLKRFFAGREKLSSCCCGPDCC